MSKRSFINKPNVKTYQVVHRSFRDPLTFDETSSCNVLKELRSQNDGEYLKQGTLHEISTEEIRRESPVVSDIPGGVVYDSTNKSTRTGIKSHLERQDEAQGPNKATKKVTFVLPEEVLPSKIELTKEEIYQDNLPQGLCLEMDPDVREVLTALDDETCDGEETIAEFLDQIVQSGETDLQQYRAGFDQTASAIEEREEDWQALFRKFKLEQSRKTGCDEEEDDKKTTASKYSMTSSAIIRRNDKLTLIDEQFEEIEKYYSKPSEEEKVLANAEIQEDLDQALDEFLETYEIAGKKLVKKNMDIDTDGSLAKSAKDVPEVYHFTTDRGDEDNQFDVLQFSHSEREAYGSWDCETILTTCSNMENRPKIVPDASHKKIEIHKKTGMPVVSRKLDSFMGSPMERRDAMRSTENLGMSRPKLETKEEKRLRKNAVKEHKRRVRQETKIKREESRFSSLKTNQMKVISMAANPPHYHL